MDQIEVAHPLPQLGIGQTVMFFRRREQRLGEKIELLDKNRQLAGPRPLQFAIHADKIAQVEQLGQFPMGLTDLIFTDKELDFSGPVLDVGKNQLALAPLDLKPVAVLVHLLPLVLLVQNQFVLTQQVLMQYL